MSHCQLINKILAVTKISRYKKSDEEISTLIQTEGKKSTLFGRVGVSTEKRKLASVIDIVVEKKTKKLKNITEE